MTTSSKAITARFGATVRNLRLRLGVSQEELAERAELHRTYIAGIEAGGRNLTLKSITKLASALEVSTSELLAFGDKAGGGSEAPSWGGSNGKIVAILLFEDNPAPVKLSFPASNEIP